MTASLGVWGLAWGSSDPLGCWTVGPQGVPGVAGARGEEPWAAALGRTGPLPVSVPYFLCDLGRHFWSPRLSLLFHPFLLNTYGRSQHSQHGCPSPHRKKPDLHMDHTPSRIRPHCLPDLTSLRPASSAALALLQPHWPCCFPLPFTHISAWLTPLPLSSLCSGVTFSIMPTRPPYWMLQSIHRRAHF